MTLRFGFYFVLLAFLVATPAYAAYQEGTVSNAGSIKGRVTFKGALPPNAIEKIRITKNPEICGSGNREVVWVDVGKEGALRGVVVFLDRVNKGKPWPKPKGGKFMIDQKGCRFRPWVQIIRQGAFVVRNSDQTLHNIHVREMIGVERKRVVRRTIFNFGQPEAGDVTKKIKTRRSPFLSVNCEAHNFMFAWMFAPKNPYAVVVGEDGSYQLDDIPSGSYTLEVWHPRLGLRKTKVNVAPKKRAEANFEFTK